jgi:hypothetical protein
VLVWVTVTLLLVGRGVIVAVDVVAVDGSAVVCMIVNCRDVLPAVSVVVATASALVDVNVVVAGGAFAMLGACLARTIMDEVLEVADVSMGGVTWDVVNELDDRLPEKTGTAEMSTERWLKLLGFEEVLKFGALVEDLLRDPAECDLCMCPKYHEKSFDR